MLLDGSAQLALMFEREHLDNREQFVELKREALIPVISNNHPSQVKIRLLMNKSSLHDKL